MSALLAALVLAVAGPAGQELRTFTPVEMQEDLFLLTEKLTSLHGGLVRYATEEEIERVFSAAFLAVEEGPRDALWFYRKVCEILAAIRCGHTRAECTERERQAIVSARGLVPFEVLLAGKRAWITRVLDDSAGLSAGQELLALDGLSIEALRALAFSRLSDDGFIESGKERQLEGDFAETYLVFVSEPRSGPYELRVAGAAAPVRVAGLAPEVREARKTPRPERPLVHLELRPDDGVGLLTVSVFGDRSGEPPFLDSLEASFRRLRDDEVPHLILDLRGNGGGRDMYGARLVSYLASRPFGYFERIEVTPDYSGPVQIEERDGRRLMLSHEGLAVQQPAEHRFLGDVCILMDGFTFSTAADVCSVAHANGLATFLGEECGGGYEGNNSGDSMLLVLPNSGLRVSVPHWNYTTAGVGPGHHGRGVEPDVAVQRTIEDVLAGRDAVLERALAHVRANAKR